VRVVASLFATVLALHAAPAPPAEHAFALLAGNRIAEVALPSGKVVARRRLGPEPGGGQLESGRMLARSDERVFALVPNGKGSDSVAVLDRRTANTLAHWPLETGLRYRGLVFAADRLYAYGGRMGREVDTANHVREESAVVTQLDAANGAISGTSEIRPADGHMWRIYWGAAEANRLALSYHGGCYPEVTQLCTSGADSIDVSGQTLSRCEHRSSHASLACLEEAHGMIEPYGVGWIATTGGESLVQYGRAGNLLRRLHSGIRHDHLMDFAFTSDRSGLLVIGSCYGHEGLRRISLRTGTSRLVRRKICGAAVVPGRSALVVAQSAALEICDPRTAQPRRKRSFGAKILDVILTR
jgi:hypothetical protein